MQNGVRYPELEDQKLFGIGAGRADGALILEWHPMVAHYRSLPNNPGSPRPFLPDNRGRTEADRIAAYGRLIDARAPIDPPCGGLAADEIDGDTLRLHYWDLADDRQPFRKFVEYWPKQGDVGMRVQTWNPQRGAWEDEGFDFERDFSNALPQILQAFSMVTSALIGALTGNPALASAWSSALGIGVKAAASRVPPDPGEVLSAFGDFAGEAVKSAGKIDIGTIFGSSSMKGDFLQSFSGMLEKIRAFAAEKEIVLTFADQMRAAFQKGLGHFPSVDLSGALELGARAIAPDVFAKEKQMVGGLDPSLLAGTVSREIALAAGAFGLDLKIDTAARGAGDDTYYSIRKLSVDKATFDSTFATLAAARKAIADRDAFNAQQDKFRREHPELAYQTIGVGKPAAVQTQDAARLALTQTVKALEQRYGIS